VALVEQVGEFLFLENAEPREQFLDLAVRGIGMGNVFDLFDVTGHAVFFDPPVLGFPRVVGNEEWRIGHPRVVFTLSVVLRLDGDIVGFALDDDKGRLLIELVLNAAPNDKISAGLGAAASADVRLFPHLIDGVAIFSGQNLEVFLANPLLGSQGKPLAPDPAEDLIPFNLDFIGLDIALLGHESLPTRVIVCRLPHNCNSCFRCR